MLQVEVHHRFPGLALDISFEAAGGVTALFGRSGAGKTTVANAVAGLVRPDSGQIALNGRILSAPGIWTPPYRRRIGYVFQNTRLFPHMSVRKNLLYGAADDRHLPRVMDMLGIDHLLARHPQSLSGGEQQRVAIGRALLMNPELLIMDEPLSALDPARKAEILPWLERLRDEAGLPILYVSHSVAEVARLADRVVLIDAGRVARIGTPDLLLSDPALAPRLGPREAGGVLTGQVTEHADDGLTAIETPAGTLHLAADVAVGRTVRLRISAEDIVLSTRYPQGLSALNILPAQIDALHTEGAQMLVHLRLKGEAALVARITTRSASAMGLAENVRVFAILKSVALIHHS